jgi:hypothetical protein
VESHGTPGQSGSVQSGVAITNTASTAVSVFLELSDVDGSVVASTSINLPAYGHVAKLLNEFSFSGTGSPGLLGFPGKGVLRIAASSSAISVIGLRIRYNELGDFLISTMPAIDENAPASSSPLLFPQIADGGGYTTQIVVFSGTSGQSTMGKLTFTDENGLPLNLGLK